LVKAVTKGKCFYKKWEWEWFSRV